MLASFTNSNNVVLVPETLVTLQTTPTARHFHFAWVFLKKLRLCLGMHKEPYIIYINSHFHPTPSNPIPTVLTQLVAQSHTTFITILLTI